jgi:hypothetical protein
MKKKAITSMPVHGQTLGGRLKALISTENKQSLFEYDCKGQRAVGITIPDARRIGCIAAVRVG